MPTSNPFLDFLEGEPRAAYYSFANQFGRSPRQRDYFEDQYSRIYNQYLGTLGSQARARRPPSGSFLDFLGGFDFPGSYLNDLTFGQRNPQFSAFVPSLRWLIG